MLSLNKEIWYIMALAKNAQSSNWWNFEECKKVWFYSELNPENAVSDLCSNSYAKFKRKTEPLVIAHV
jgi:hypothetical protein